MSATEFQLPLPKIVGVPRAVCVAKVLIVAPLGLLVAVAAVAFAAAAPPSSLSAGDWAVGAWALATAAVNVAFGPRLGRGSEVARRALLVAAATHIAFSSVKLTIYHESSSYVFMALDATVLALLTRRSVSTFCGNPGRSPEA